MSANPRLQRQLTRLLRLSRRLQGVKYMGSLHGLAKDFGVCQRTIRRDLEALEAAGWTVPKWRWEDVA